MAMMMVMMMVVMMMMMMTMMLKATVTKCTLMMLSEVLTMTRMSMRCWWIWS